MIGQRGNQFRIEVIDLQIFVYSARPICQPNLFPASQVGIPDLWETSGSRQDRNTDLANARFDVPSSSSTSSHYP